MVFGSKTLLNSSLKKGRVLSMWSYLGHERLSEIYTDGKP